MSVVDPPEPSIEDRPAEPGGPRGSRAPRRGFDGRTIALILGLAALGAVLAALITVRVLGDADGEDPAASTPATLVPAGDIDGAALLDAPLVTPEGAPTSLGALDEDRPMVVNLWARTCAPCVKEMPLLEQAQAINPDLAFVGVNELDAADKAAAMAERTGITYPWLRDPDGSFANTARTVTLPDTILVSPSGEVLGTKVGAFDDLEDLQGWLDDHRAAP